MSAVSSEMPSSARTGSDEVESRAIPSMVQTKLAVSSGVPIAVIGFGFAIITFGLFEIGALNESTFAFFPIVGVTTGAVAMLFGGIWEARTENVFGATFGLAYACFLFTTGLLVYYFGPGIKATAGAQAYNDAFGAYLMIWTVFTGALTFGAYFINGPALAAFALLTVVYFCAGLASILTGSATIILTRIAGVFSLLDGIAAWWLGIGILLNTISGKDLVPMWPHRGN